MTRIKTRVTQDNSLYYSSDPNLWTIRCRMGDEKNTALQLMRKFIAYSKSSDKQPLLIKSVIVKEGIKGYIYIEAFKQPHVKAAIEDVSSLRMSIYKQEVSFYF